MIATGETNTVRRCVEIAFDQVGLDWEPYVEIDDAFKRPAEVDLLVGDPAKAKRVLGWEPQTNFEQLIRLMVDADLELLSALTRCPTPPPGRAGACGSPATRASRAPGWRCGSSRSAPRCTASAPASSASRRCTRSRDVADGHGRRGARRRPLQERGARRGRPRAARRRVPPGRAGARAARAGASRSRRSRSTSTGTAKVLEALRDRGRAARGRRRDERQVLPQRRRRARVPRGRPARRRRPVLRLEGRPGARRRGVPRARAADRHRARRQRDRRRRLGARTGCSPTACARRSRASRSTLRAPDAVRPWQHVLCPLDGYLRVAEALLDGEPTRRRRGTSAPSDARPVGWLVERVAERWPGGLDGPRRAGAAAGEAPLLRLDATRARERLGWAPRWDLEAALDATVAWYAAYRDGRRHARRDARQIAAYERRLS